MSTGWEIFIINDKDNNNRRYLNSLSLVSKQFLSVTNPFLFSLFLSFNNPFTLYDESPCCRLFNRFTNVNSLKLRGNIETFLFRISSLPLKLTSLNISYIPTNALRTFSQKITTLTSLTCCKINSFDLLLIAECFPFLEELDLSNAYACKPIYGSYLDDRIEALSLALIKLRKVNLTGVPIKDQSLSHLFNNCKYLEEVIISKCHEITREGLASAIRERLTLRSLSFSTTYNPEHGQVFTTSQFIDSLVSLKGLTSLVLHCLNISDELLYSIAREGLPLTRLDLYICNNYSYAGIFCLLSQCQRIQHLNLESAIFLNDQHVVELSSFLGDLVSINLSCCYKLTKSALVALAKNCSSLSEIKMVRIGSHVTPRMPYVDIGHYDNLVDFGVYPHLKALYLGCNSWYL
ncbi:hypothetical protein TSUD_285920 [Trifolium subterraneum]|uniref:F-box domain-containing protein n=1 Tax=Trifolium subterraneum TaxID=3900 RepID=A0A2Z6PA39_TRISU|nr:hypothetical protein TSUD_285920 [Trifolium subterraneum]